MQIDAMHWIDVMYFTGLHHHVFISENDGLLQQSQSQQ
jgi:hypothetical protein